MTVGARTLGIIFCAAVMAAVPGHAAETSRTPETRQFPSATAALKQVIRSGALEYFPARNSYTGEEWLTPEGDDATSPADLALSSGNQWRFIPEKILFSEAMAPRRWEKVDGKVLMIRALEEGRGDKLLTDGDFKKPESFWMYDVGGEPFACKLIETGNLKKVGPALFRETPHGMWKDMSCGGKPVTVILARNDGLMKSFFTAQNWIGRTGEMRETYGWLVESRAKAGKTGASSAYSDQSFERLYNEAQTLTKNREGSARRSQITASADKPAVYPPG